MPFTKPHGFVGLMQKFLNSIDGVYCWTSLIDRNIYFALLPWKSEFNCLIVTLYIVKLC